MEKIVAVSEANGGGTWSIANALEWSMDSKLPKTPNTKGINNQQAAIQDFLSLYAVTRNQTEVGSSDGVNLEDVPTEGSRGSLTIVNGGTKKEQIRTALFGDGTKEKGLISKVLIGGTSATTKGSGPQNSYENIRTILSNLGINNANSRDHQNHFHIYIRPPERLQIGGKTQNLETFSINVIEAQEVSKDLQDGQQLLNLTHQMLNQISSSNQQCEVNMFALDVPSTPIPDVSLSQVVSLEVKKQEQKSLRVKAEKKQEQKVSVWEPCLDVDSTFEDSAFNTLAVLHSVYSSLGYDPIKYVPLDIRNSTIVNISVLPLHGAITRLTPESYFWYYKPEPGYVGSDKVTFEIEAKGRKFRYTWNLLVHEVVDEGAKPPVCEKYFRKNSNNQSMSLYQNTSGTTWDSWLQPSMFSNGAFEIKNINISFSDVSGVTLAQTKGEGLNAQITLDTNAAGHGWFIDDTPDNNDEFLPTADPEVWIAKAGTAAAGKIDMLSVLLHEYGHALGIEHSGDNADYMAASLQPGQRRLPSTEELSLMSRLVAALKGGTESDPNDPMNPNLPLSSLGLMALCRIRRADYGWTLGIDKAQLVSRVDVNNLLQNANQPAQLQTVVNSTLNQDSNAWQTTGNVGNSDGNINLAESATNNTHLSQSFAVKQGDCYLSFTVANNHLQSNGVDEDGNGNGPNDAFEVALLNANTGLSVADTTGLSRSDALLNIQTDGTQSRAASVRKVHNADGSDTYYVDLQQAVNESNGLVTGTPVTLSFDLMGFGVQNSQVSLRDIKLIQDPVAFDDVVTSDEDVTVTLDVLSNDLLGGGVANTAAQLNIVNQPAHGIITINADGTISYVPAAHFYGTDSFTYTTTVDGRVSNQATVSLNVRHVNHAPVVSTDNVAMTVTAGRAVEIKPLTLSQASDIDGDVLRAAITTQPAHGTVVVNADGSWTYTADADYAGTDSLSFHVVDTNTDGSGEVNNTHASSAIVTVHFTVEPANTAPVANNVHLTLLEDGSININFADAASGLGNDAEGDALIATITAQPSHGSLTLNADGTYTYVPTQYFHGDDAIRFTLNDGKLNSQEATISLHVTHVNHVATVSNSIVALDEDSSVKINWTSTANDVDGDSLTACIVSQAAHGTVVINADGTFTYLANANYNGAVSFSYVVNDGSVDSKVAKVSVSPAI